MTKVKTKTTTKTKASEGRVTKIGTERHKVVREEILKFHNQINENYLDLSKLLSEAYHNDFAEKWGFGNFEEYCHKELDEKYRKARYLIEIWDKVKSLQLDEKRIRNLGWTKMKDLAAVITEDNAKEWLDKAEKMSSREVTEAVKILRRSDTSQVQVPMVTTLKLTMSDSEAHNILEAIAEGKKLTGSDNDVVALEMICQDWMEEKGATPSLSSLTDKIKYLEKVYNVDIGPIAPKDAQGSEIEESAEELLDKAEETDATSDIDLADGDSENLEDILGLEDGE